MTVLRINDGRVVLRRSKESRILHILGMAVVTIMLLIAVWYLVAGFRSRDVFWAALGFFLALLVVPFGVILFDQYFLRVILSETYISFQTWHAAPHVYAYDDISDIENVIVDPEQHHWRGSHVKLTFADGRSFKIGHGLVSAREFRSLLREKSGRTFRKKRSSRSRWWNK